MNLTLVIILFTQIVWSSALTCKNGEQIFRRGIKVSDRNKILRKHNVLRNQVAEGSVATQDPAQNMRTMTWDSELTTQAQKWADNCEFEHDPNLKNSKGEPVGQNLAIMYTTDRKQMDSPNFENLIQMWFDEVKDHGYKNDGTFQHESGHYSQMIWAKSNKVGCGFSSYQPNSRMIAIYLVCNYYPAGNFVGQRAYVPGKRNCRAHKLTDSTRFTSLCN